MRLYLATGNSKKLRELVAILETSGVAAEVIPASAVGGMPEVEEDTGTFVGNARKKATALADALRQRDPAWGSGADDPKLQSQTPYWVVADDSGVCVDALDGHPGVESAYYGGRPSNDAANNARLLKELAGVPAERRSAAFHCVILALSAVGKEMVFEGRCTGRIIESELGTGGFGYDPLFIPDGCTQSYAELSNDVKHRISHRAQALAKFTAWLRTQG